jgi:putative hydrolase of the HAD superfamily
MIKNILFDLGNVLLNLSESDNYKAMEFLLDPSKSEDINTTVFYPFEKGEISEESFVNRLQRRSKFIMPFEIYYHAWNAMLLDFPARRIDLLRDLKNKYRIFLISNTNITHIRKVNRIFQNDHQIEDFRSLFEKVYLSFEIGMRKPDAEFYNYVLNDAAININETILIDDNPKNVEGAIKIGLPVHLHNPAEDVVEVVYRLLK